MSTNGSSLDLGAMHTILKGKKILHPLGSEPRDPGLEPNVFPLHHKYGCGRLELGTIEGID